jgi:hypothetical protein
MPLTRIQTAALQSSITGSNITDGTIAVADLSTGAPSWLSSGYVGVGTASPDVKLELSGSNNSTWSAATSTISGVTMTVGTVTGTIAIGDIVFGIGVQPYTRITAGSGSSWTVSVYQTVASATFVGGPAYGNTLIRITDTDTGVNANQPTGGLQFFTSDTSSPTAGVGAYVAAMNEDTTPDTALVFGTRAAGGGGVDANERMRVDSVGNVGIGTASPIRTLDVSAASATVFLTSSTGTNRVYYGTSNTGGGTSVTGSWQTMPFNTEILDPSNLVTLLTNVFTVQPGTWLLQFTGGIFSVAAGNNLSQIRINNITAGTQVRGPSQSVLQNGTALHVVRHYYVLGVATQFRVEYRASCCD